MKGACLILVGAFSSIFQAGAADPGTNACVANLRNIYSSIQEYRRQYKELPGTLGELYPKFLSDPRAFKCPAGDSYKIAGWKGSNVFDSATTYIYEFGTNAVPQHIPGANGTMREWKRMQMSFVGGVVPMVRCFAHGGQVLSLRFDGTITAGGREWEKEDVLDVVAVRDLLVTRLLAGGRPVRVVTVPPREGDTPATLLDLGSAYNASLSAAWEPGDPSRHLGNLPTGRRTIGGVEFDVRGLAQLSGERFVSEIFPVAITNIPVGLRCSRLHFLHGGAFGASSGIKVNGHYVLHFDGGRTEAIPIVYGEDIVEWRAESEGRRTLPDPRLIAWQGEAGSGSSTRVATLYRKTWENPLPEVLIRRLDFVSAKDGTAPFLIAVTLDP